MFIDFTKICELYTFTEMCSRSKRRAENAKILCHETTEKNVRNVTRENKMFYLQ